MERKGISPLIAAVLLIAFTMAVAAILTAWVTSFTQSTTEDVGNRSEQLVSCSFAGLSIYDAILSGSDLTVSMANTGTKDLGEVSVVVFHEDGSTNQTSVPGLESGNVDDTSIQVGTGTATDISRVRIASTECPEITDETTTITENN